MGRSRCSGERGDELESGFWREMRTIISPWGPEEHWRVPGWRQRFENHLWRHRVEVDKMPQDGQVALKTGPIASYTQEKTLKFADLDCICTQPAM